MAIPTSILTEGQAIALAAGKEPKFVSTMTATMMVIVDREGVQG